MSWKHHEKGPLRPFYHQLVKVSLTILIHVHASTHRQSFRYSVFVPLSPLGSIWIIFFLLYQKFFQGRRLALSLRMKGAKAIGLMQSIAGSVSIQAFCLFSALGTESFVAFKKSKQSEDLALWCFILLKLYQIRLLARSYNGLYF